MGAEWGQQVVLCVCIYLQMWVGCENDIVVMTFERQLKFSLSEPNFYKTLIFDLDPTVESFLSPEFPSFLLELTSAARSDLS